MGHTRTRLIALICVLAGSLATTGCQRASVADTSSPVTASAAPTREAAPKAVLTVSPAPNATKVRPDTPVVVKVSGGRLGAVSVTASTGAKIAGAVASDGTWRSTAPLPVSATLKVSAGATNADGALTSLSSSFSTLKPKDTEKVSVVPRDGAVVGVGMPIIVTFDHKVTNKAAVEKKLKVESVPMVSGAWHWVTSREVQYRPAEFWPGRTKIKVTADLTGVEIAPGIWGASRKPVNFTIGQRQVVTVSLSSHTLTLERDGSEVKTLPVTNGEDGHPRWETRTGTKVIMTQEISRVMDAATTGVPTDDPDYYNLDVKYAMRLTNTGEFIHAAPWSEWAQGERNVSHGCTGLSTANARWLMENTRVGDPVIVVGGCGALEPGNGWTLWNVTWQEWQAGSALTAG